MQHQGVPLDIINEIRGRLPPKSLVRFRCISKAWNDITNDHDLARKQLLRSGQIRDPQLLCLINFHGEQGGKTITSKVSKQSIEINIAFYGLTATCCNGWHCFGPLYTYKRRDAAPIIMHNPLRQETLELPQISSFTTEDGQSWYGLGFDARNNIFKLTCLFVSDSTTEFYVLRHKESWEQLELPSRLRNCRHLHLFSRTVFANESIHYVVQAVGNARPTILAFDVEKEQFKLVDSPSRFRFHEHHVLMELEGVLAAYLYCTRTDLKELYVLKDYANGEWDAPLRIPVSEMGMKLIQDDRFKGSWGTQLLFRRYNHHRTYQYLACDIQTGKFTYKDFCHFPCNITELYGHQLSLVPLNM